MVFDMNLYRPTLLETKIEKYYKDFGILTPLDLTIGNVAHAFGVDVEYYDGKPFADWIGTRGIVVLNEKDEFVDQRADFFHEVAHIVLHVGDQKKLNSLFVELQEAQSLRFQQYASMPFFMITDFAYNSYNSLVHTLSESFALPLQFVQQRVNQILNRIEQERLDIEYKSNLFPNVAPIVTTLENYNDDTIRIFNQLHCQVEKQKQHFSIQ